MNVHPVLQVRCAFDTMGVVVRAGSSDTCGGPAEVTWNVVAVVRNGAADRSEECDLVTLTSVIDNRAHVVTDIELSSPRAMQAGRYEALCGHLISPAPMVEPDGTRCRRCAELDRATRDPARVRRSRLRRLLA